MASEELNPHLPARFVELKQEIASTYPDFEQRVTRAWNEILEVLGRSTKVMVEKGTENIPHVNYADLDSLTPEQVEEIRKKGCVVIKDVVDDAEVAKWREDLKEFVKANPSVPGFPEEDKQFFHLYWTRSQVLARAHPNVLNATTFLNKLYHVKDDAQLDGIDLSTPLVYADRFRIRHPGIQWDAHPPHVDGGAIERWEDPTFRKCFAEILSGDWRKHDPYDLEGRVNARSSLYQRPGQATIFRTFQGWLALSETAPHQGTLKLFPDIVTSNAYSILRPFFRPKATPVSDDPLDVNNWEYDISSPDFPGIFGRDKGFVGPRPNNETHPHFRLDETMTSVPKVYPGDMVFWHCDLVHSVEKEHTGNDDSAVMYIPAVPTTPQNKEYVRKQNETFVQGITPPDFAKLTPEATYVGTGKPEDIVHPLGKQAMGFQIEVA
ncbi:DUF1479-domain-containing protein [Dentipellis sp. KUC8613]|nr:DUF1479-domain-containing protein [Dentipellis sp. KUC8613]